MVKVPRPGRVKTRLGKEIGMITAAWWFRHQVASLIRRLRDPRWEVVLAVSPDREGLLCRVWPADLPRVPQGPGDLGDRMGRLLRSLRPGSVLIIGADVPEIGRRQIAGAFRRLGSADAVIGPAKDGGYWLIGWKGPAPPPARIFEGVRWSTEHAMADTLDTLKGHRVAKAEMLADVDRAADLSQPTF